jgi:hypothetical protein
MDYMSSRILSASDSLPTLTAEQRNQNMFYALRLESSHDDNPFLVIFGGFSIMGTLVMVVMESARHRHPHILGRLRSP